MYPVSFFIYTNKAEIDVGMGRQGVARGRQGRGKGWLVDVV